MVSGRKRPPEYKVAADALRSAAAGELASDRIGSAVHRHTGARTENGAYQPLPVVARSTIVVKPADAGCSAALRPFG